MCLDDCRHYWAIIENILKSNIAIVNIRRGFVFIKDSPFIGSVEALVAANRICDGPTKTNLGDLAENQRSIRDCIDTMNNRRLNALESKHTDDMCAAMA